MPRSCHKLIRRLLDPPSRADGSGEASVSRAVAASGGRKGFAVPFVFYRYPRHRASRRLPWLAPLSLVFYQSFLTGAVLPAFGAVETADAYSLRVRRRRFLERVRDDAR